MNKTGQIKNLFGASLCSYTINNVSASSIDLYFTLQISLYVFDNISFKLSHSREPQNKYYSFILQAAVLRHFHVLSPCTNVALTEDSIVPSGTRSPAFCLTSSFPHS